MAQLVTRIDGELATHVDEPVEPGVVESRSEAVRQGLNALIAAYKRSSTAQAMVDGYERNPESGADVSWPDSATVGKINHDPLLSHHRATQHFRGGSGEFEPDCV